MESIHESLSQTPGILGILYRNYLNNSDRNVIVVGNSTITYAELIDKGERVASALYLMGIRQGDRIGVLTPNSVNWYIFMYAIVRLGAVVVPFDPQMGEFEIRYLFDKVGIRLVLVPPKFRGLNHPAILENLKRDLPDLKSVIVDGSAENQTLQHSFADLLNHEKIKLPEIHVTPEDSNVFFCTTGSTGNPKIVDLPCRIINYNIERNSTRWGFVENDKFLLSMPLYHCAGFGWGLSALSAGGTIYYEEFFSPTAYLTRIQNDSISKMLTTPTIAKILLTHPKFSQFDVSSMKQIIFTGEYLSDELAGKFRNEFGMRVTNALGMTETFVYLDWDSERDAGISANCLGKIPGIGIRVVGEDGAAVAAGGTGQIHICNSVMNGYFRLQEVTRETIDVDGWLNSGDLAAITEEGRIKFVGRKKRVVKRGGNLVSPEEIEQFLRTHQHCAAAIVDSEPDEIMGEKIIAYLQPAEGVKLGKDDMLSFCRGKISSYKIPDEFYFLKEVPKTVGKANPTLLKKLKESAALVEC